MTNLLGSSGCIPIGHEVLAWYVPRDEFIVPSMEIKFKFGEDEKLETMMVIITHLDGKEVNLPWTDDSFRANLGGISQKEE